MLLSMLYPDYEKMDGGASRIKTSPLFKLRFMNLIQNVTSPGLSAKDGGLLGKVSGFTYEPDLEQGFFDSFRLHDEAIEVHFAIHNDVGETIIPQTIKLACEFTVLHQHPLGWENNQPRNGFSGFPYKNPRVQFLPPNRDLVKPPSVDTNSSFDDRKKEKIKLDFLKPFNPSLK